MYAFDKFDAQTMSDCLLYVQKGYEWLQENEGDVSQFSAFKPLDMKAIDGITAAMIHLTSQLNVLRNRFLPIYKLPAELVAPIFVSVVDPPALKVGDGIGPELYHDALKALTTLALVCRYWHDVAMRTSSLWSQIFYSINPDDHAISLSVALRHFERSGTAPLAVRCDMTRTRHFPILLSNEDSTLPREDSDAQYDRLFCEHIGRHLFRVQDLRIVSDGRPENLSFLHSNAAPQLQTLLLEGPDHTPDHDSADDVLTPYHSILDKSSSPVLRILSVSNIRSWTQPRLSTNLRCLCVLHQTWSTRADVVKASVAFAALPALEELIISLHGHYEDSNGEATDGRYTLQALKRFMMTDTTTASESATYLLSLLLLPDDCVQRVAVSTWKSCMVAQLGVNMIARAQKIYLCDTRMVAVRDSSTAYCLAVLSNRCKSIVDVFSEYFQAVTELWVGADFLPKIYTDKLSTVTKIVFTSDWTVESFLAATEDDTFLADTEDGGFPPSTEHGGFPPTTESILITTSATEDDIFLAAMNSGSVLTATKADSLPALQKIYVFLRNQSDTIREDLHHYLERRHKAGRTLKVLRFFVIDRQLSLGATPDDDLPIIDTVDLCSMFQDVVTKVSLVYTRWGFRGFAGHPALCTVIGTLQSG